MNWSERLLRWIEPEDNPRNTIYGTIAAGLVIAAEDPTRETYPRVVAATAVAVATYWLAHGYAHWVAERFGRRANAEGSRPSREILDALIHEWPLAEGAAVPVAALLIAWATGARLTVGTAAALATAAGALIMFELAGGLRRRLQPARLVANAAVGLVLGAALFAVKSLLH
jgi:hypothetical protein